MIAIGTGDLVELRGDAEQGVHRVFEVIEVRGDGSLGLRQRGGNGSDATVFIGIAGDDVAEDIFRARPEIIEKLGVR